MDDERELRERSETIDSGDDIEDTEWASDDRLVSCGYVGDNLDGQRSPRFAPTVQAAWDMARLIADLEHCETDATPTAGVLYAELCGVSRGVGKSPKTGAI